MISHTNDLNTDATNGILHQRCFYIDDGGKSYQMLKIYARKSIEVACDYRFLLFKSARRSVILSAHRILIIIAHI